MAKDESTQNHYITSKQTTCLFYMIPIKCLRACVRRRLWGMVWLWFWETHNSAIFVLNSYQAWVNNEPNENIPGFPWFLVCAVHLWYSSQRRALFVCGAMNMAYVVIWCTAGLSWHIGNHWYFLLKHLPPDLNFNISITKVWMRLVHLTYIEFRKQVHCQTFSRQLIHCIGKCDFVV